MRTEKSNMKRFMESAVFASLVLLGGSVLAQSTSFQGQASGWLALTKEPEIGLRYIPEFRLASSLDDERTVDAEIALNSRAALPFESPGDFDSDIELYRLWLRYSSSQFEARLGLQKVNFGPAKIMRSLMWFDRLDPQDPFKLTDGVYAMLTRYYFLNNANVWVWGLPGSDTLKGLEFVKTDDDHVELGGRFQFPIPRGELAVSYNRRRVDPEDWDSKMTGPLTDGLENRLAVDGIWDIGIGLWFEALAERTKIDSDQQMLRGLVTIGGDYTLESGIHLLYEHFVQSTGSEIDQMDLISNLSALSADYAIGIMDRINAIAYFDWEQKDAYAYIGWQRTYDNWQINLLAFSNREDSTAAFSGKGVQCIVTYNH